MLSELKNSQIGLEWVMLVYLDKSLKEKYKIKF